MKEEGKEYPKQGGGQHASLLNTAADLERVWSGPIKLNSVFPAGVEGLEDAKEFWGTPYLLEQLEEAAPTYKVAALCTFPAAVSGRKSCPG